jgi:hypothetical protein
MDDTKKENFDYDINEILDRQDENTVDYADTYQVSHPLFGAVPPPLGPITSSQAGNYSNITVTTGSGGYNSISSPYIYTAGTGVTNNLTSKITLEGDKADIIVNGKSLIDTLMALEKRLDILVPNPKLEAEWEELKRLGDEYRALEAKLTEQAEVWRRLAAT